MNKLITTNNGGFPAKLDDVRWSDDGYRSAFKGIMSAFGITGNTAVVLSGCTRTQFGSNITIAEGYISISGEICFVPSHTYPAPVGSEKEYWAIATSFDNAGLKVFQNSVANDTYQVRVGKVLKATTVPSGSTLFGDAKTIFQVINSNIDNMPTGAIIMWSGAISALPFGYALCNGANGTPDLRSRFVVGYDDRSTQPTSVPHWDVTYTAVGSMGGAKRVTLSKPQIPPHYHGITVDNSDGGDFETIVIPNAFIGTSDRDPGLRTSSDSDINPTFNTESHENRPPYYVVAFIIKVGTFVPGNSNTVTPSTPVSAG